MYIMDVKEKIQTDSVSHSTTTKSTFALRKKKYHPPPGKWAYHFIRNTSKKDIALT